MVSIRYNQGGSHSIFYNIGKCFGILIRFIVKEMRIPPYNKQIVIFHLFNDHLKRSTMPRNFSMFYICFFDGCTE